MLSNRIGIIYTVAVIPEKTFGLQKGIIMFNMENVGQRISEFRKEKNMTQMELADRMNISFQAVSNWERGISMPDISKLPELAEMFDVTIGELLGEHSELIEKAASEELDEYLESNSVSAAELTEAAPVHTPRQVDTDAEKMNISRKPRIFFRS